MANLLVLDGNGSTKIMMATGDGTADKPLVIEHKDSEVGDKLEELIGTLGKPSDVNDLYPYQLNGIEGNPPIPYNVTQLLRCLNISTYSIEEKMDAVKQGDFEQKQILGHIYELPATYEQVVGTDQYGNPNPLSLISLAKGILRELHLLRTGVTT